MNDDLDIRVKPVTRDHDRDDRQLAYDDRSGRRVERDRHDYRETTPFYRTSEFMVLVAGVAALLVAGLVGGEDALNNFHMWALVTALASAYVLSRGIAKAGTRDRD